MTPHESQCLPGGFVSCDLDGYKADVERLADAVIKIFGSKQELLLSPLWRDVMRENAEKVLEKHLRLAPMLMLDNPGKPLGEG